MKIATEPPRFDPHLALLLAEHAQAVYLEPDDFWQWAMDRGYDNPLIAVAGAAQVGITCTPERIIVAARGSSQERDWFENLLAFQWSYRKLFPVGRTHLGFQIQARRIGGKVLRAVQTTLTRRPSAEVFIVGHSLGGALCHFLLRLLETSGVTVSAVYTLESPRVFTREAAEWFDARYRDRTFRVVAIRQGSADIVTRLPPSVFGWQHVGQPVMIRDGVLFQSEEEWQKARAAHPVAPLPWWRIGSRMAVGVAAHMCGALVKELRVIARDADAL